MRTIMLDKLYACVLFFPQLQVTIDRRRNDEVRTVALRFLLHFPSA